MPPVMPSLFAYVVYRTKRHAEMLSWYKTVFGATVQHQDPALAFLTYDDEHHRFAFVDLDVVQPKAKPGCTQMYRNFRFKLAAVLDPTKFGDKHDRPREHNE